jgi:acyl-CoA synthetase (AMP-forming)/AMP-acid ligase II
MAVHLNSRLELSHLPTLTFIGKGPDRELNLAICGGRIAALASAIGKQYPPNARVGLLYRSEPMLVLSWLAILAAGLEPLILHYPNPKQNLAAWRQSIEHTFRLVDLAGIVCTQELEQSGLGAFRPLFPGDGAHSGEGAALPPLGESSTLLQMSSGTTGQRKPIRFTLAQVAAHVRDYNDLLHLGPDDRIVSWLPLYHDMGFVACFLMPLMLGVPVVMMDPMHWVREPKRLLQAINEYATTTCFMPNFGFEVMAKHAAGQSFPTMRRWVSCSEPVYPETMKRFAAATGAGPERLSACYAMAENVFAVSHQDGFVERRLDGKVLTSCGMPIPNTQLKLVDGEIWVRSPYSLDAYVGGAKATDTDGFYGTGDLGAFVDGELVVVGRKHDVINVAGRKYFLNDLDQALGRALPGVDGRAVTLACRESELGTELPLFLIEDRDFYLRTDLQQQRARMGTEVDVESFTMEYVPPGFLTKTSSGKFSRAVTVANHDLARRWRSEHRAASLGKTSVHQEFQRLFGSLPRDKPVSTLLDSLGLVSLSLMMEDAGLRLDPTMSLGDHRTALEAHEAAGERQRHTGQGQEEHIAVVSLADSRTIAKVTDAHLQVLATAAGLPVTLEHVCLPPTPVVLSDLVFADYFLARDFSEKYQPALAELTKLRRASLLLVDDVGELLFGQFAYPAFNHRFERSAPVDLLAWRWQKYAQRHHELPISIVNLWQTHALRNEFIQRLSRYLGIPLFRIATLKSFAEITANWEFVDRTNADWTMELDVNVDAMVSRLAGFLRERRAILPRRRGVAQGMAVIQDTRHFCSMFVDRQKVDEVLAQYQRFCILGAESSLPYVGRRLRDLGKRFVQTGNLNLRGQGLSDEDFDCVLQTGTWGRPETHKPVFQIFDAGWDARLQPGVVNGRPITDAQWFHANPTTAPNEIATEKGILWLLGPRATSPIQSGMRQV